MYGGELGSGIKGERNRGREKEEEEGKGEGRRKKGIRKRRGIKEGDREMMRWRNKMGK